MDNDIHPAHTSMARYHHSNKNPSKQPDHETSLDNQFQFVSANHINEPSGRAINREARSHAILRGLQAKRNLEQHAGRNFRVFSLEDPTGKSPMQRQRRQVTVAPSNHPWAGELAPFQIRTDESPGIQFLLAHCKSPRGAVPVFTVSDELILLNFRSILQNSLDDTALLSAVRLTVSFALSSGNMDMASLQYQSEALSSIRKRLSSSNGVASEPTLAAILMLAGIEARLGMPRQVQLHMGAIQRIVGICQRKGVYLSDEIKRAIFWSDLNGSIMAGSSRLFNHNTFSELEWHRDTISPDSFTLPPGFAPVSQFLDRGFIEILRDIHALKCIRDNDSSGVEDAITMAQIDNHQASIQSRIVDLPSGSCVSESCYLAAYLCSTMLRCQIWRTSTAPSYFSRGLLYKLQSSNSSPLWDDISGLLVWLLFIGGAFAPEGAIRSDYILLLQKNRRERFGGLYTSWEQLLEILEKFIWSEWAFAAQVRAFWEELSE